MIVVTVELLPGGYAPARLAIGKLQISNCSDLAPISDYVIDVLEAANPVNGAPARIGRSRVEGHDRALSIWALLERAAAAAQHADLLDL